MIKSTVKIARLVFFGLVLYIGSYFVVGRGLPRRTYSESTWLGKFYYPIMHLERTWSIHKFMIDQYVSTEGKWIESVDRGVAGTVTVEATIIDRMISLVS